MKTKSQKRAKLDPWQKRWLDRHKWWMRLGDGAYMKPRLIHHLLLAAAILSCCLPAAGQLTVVVTPGYQFSPNETPTVATLNELGIPTMAIYGTLGSNSIAPGTINGVECADSLPDGGVLGLPVGATMGWNAASPRQLAVNTVGIVDGLGGVQSDDTNALGLTIDRFYFQLLTNDPDGNNIGNPWTNWLTLKAKSLTPQLMAAMPQIITNIYLLPGPLFYTNYSTNVNTALMSSTNGFQVLSLGSEFTIVYVPTTNVFFTNATTYITTNYIPTLQAIGFNGSLPLQGNTGPWTNGQSVNTGTQNATSQVENAYSFGGGLPYTNDWNVGVYATAGSATEGITQWVTNAAGNGTNSSQVVLRARFNIDGGGGWMIYELSDELTDQTGQRVQTPPVFYSFHEP